MRDLQELRRRWPDYEFFDEDNEASGRGWVTVSPDGTLEGHIYFHLGEDSGFRATRFEDLDGGT